MTKEEKAIIILKNEQPHCGEKLAFTEEERYEAYNLAIKALEQEPKTDVLDEIKAEIKQLPYQRIFGNVSSYSLLDVVVEIIDKYREEQEDGNG